MGRKSKQQPNQPLLNAGALGASPDNLQLIHKKTLAELLGVHTWTIDLWRKKGRIPPPICLSPQIVCWRRVDIERWLAQREVQPIKTRDTPNQRARRHAQAEANDAV
jgi:predicted DNA-binding transcriptional regulator AlpA